MINRHFGIYYRSTPLLPLSSGITSITSSSSRSCSSSSSSIQNDNSIT